MKASTVRNIHPVVRYRVMSARYADKRVMRGGRTVCTSHSNGFVRSRTPKNESKAVKRAIPWAKTLMNRASTGCGRRSDSISSTGSRNAGREISAAVNSTMVVVESELIGAHVTVAVTRRSKRKIISELSREPSVPSTA